MAGETGLEPATFAVTGRRCNQLNYSPAEGARNNQIAFKTSNLPEAQLLKEQFVNVANVKSL